MHDPFSKSITDIPPETYLFGAYPDRQNEALADLERVYALARNNEVLLEKILHRLVLVCGGLGEAEKAEFYQKRLYDL